MSPNRRPSRVRSARLAATVAVVALVAAACGASSSPPPGNAGASADPGSAPPAPTPAGPVATPDLIDGLPDDTLLVPPDPAEGDVPAAVPAPEPVTGTLALGGTTALAAGTVDAAGGTIRVAQARHPLDGLTIEVPAGTYAAPVEFRVEASPIESATFAGLVPVSELVRVENGGAPATGEPVRVTIPAQVPADGSVQAFYYEAATGTVAPLPVVDQDASSVTVAAAHFSDIWLATVDWAKLGETVDSGFRPGVDDWQFTNYGSYAAPGGHCEGQVMSAMWYYRTQRLGAGASPLYGLYDNNGAGGTMTFWPDDSDGYRLASAVQASAIADPSTYTFATGLGALAGAYAFNAFRAAIWATGEPQLMAIHDSQGGHGHAIIAYRVTKDRIFVADPNYPGRLRTIKYDAATGVLGPYSSGDSAGSIAAGGEVSYTRFALIPAQASAGDGTIAGLWADFEASASGQGVFPAYALEAWEGVDEDGNDIWVPLENGYATPEEKLRVRLVPKGGEQMTMAAYQGTESRPVAGWGTDVDLALKKDGANEVGFQVKAAKDGAWRYVDFERLTINRGLIDINGSWTGTLTFTDITVDKSTLSDAELEGCNWELLEALEDAPLGLTLDVTADEAGDGSATMTIDASEVAGEDAEGDPVEIDLVYRDGAISFNAQKLCEGEGICSMDAVVARKDGRDQIAGSLSVKGPGYSGQAEWLVLRDE
jgi:hypothetical protein